MGRHVDTLSATVSGQQYDGKSKQSEENERIVGYCRMLQKAGMFFLMENTSY